MEKIKISYTKTGQEPRKYEFKRKVDLKKRMDLLGMILLLKDKDIDEVFKFVVGRIVE